MAEWWLTSLPAEDQYGSDKEHYLYMKWEEMKWYPPVSPN